MNDAKGENFYKIHELQNQSIKHHCESCIFTEHCTHECCLKLYPLLTTIEFPPLYTMRNQLPSKLVLFIAKDNGLSLQKLYH